MQAAVQHLYDVFTPYDRLSKFVGCACSACVSEAENEAVHSKPLRDLTPQDLAPIVNSVAVQTEDLKHLLPCMAELVAEWCRRFGRHYPAEYLFYTAEPEEGWNQWRSWPAREQRAVEDYFFALWRATLTRGVAEVHAGEVLHIITQVIDDLAPYLAIWQTGSSTSSLLHLLTFIEENLASVALYHGIDRFYKEKTTGQAEQIVVWLTNPRTEAIY